VVKEAAIQ